MATRDAEAPRRQALGELAWLFLRLGTTAFGGPAAHIAMMEDEVVRRRRWLTREQFLDLLGATNLIPGPNSTELAIHIGHARAGWHGLFVAGACFILPAAVIVTACAWLYVQVGRLPEFSGILYGVKPVVIAVVLQALWRLARTALRGAWPAFFALCAAVANCAGAGEIAVLGGTALVAGAVHLVRRSGTRSPPGANCHPLALAPWVGSSAFAGIGGVAPVASAGTAVGLLPLFAFFVKVGSVLFGSGYVLLAFLRGGLVHDRGWLTEAQLLDAVAIGQVTPGPVFTTATFIGYLLAGGAGAVAATAGIFLPAFVFVAISGPLVPRLRRSPLAGAVLDGVNAASLALMAVVTAQLAQAAVVDWTSLSMALAAALGLFSLRVNSSWLVLGGAVAGLVVKA
ncbi:MAG TPA: chromate efflux transporter [Myxococcota bacterium]|nr:chromate efflux transporter [Myxococcota bacterium]